MQQTLSRSAAATRAFCLACGLGAELFAGVCAMRAELPQALALHAGSALALGLWASVGVGWARLGPLAAAAVFAFTLPGIGALGLCGVVVPAWRRLRPAADDGIMEIELPAAGSSGADEGGSRMSVVPIEDTLRGDLAAAKRVAAVMALRKMDALRAVPLLRVALGDTHEDVRLLAYAILERREKELRGRIERLELELESFELEQEAHDLAPRAAVLKALAEQHWELVHGGFVSGEVETRTLTAGLRLGHESLRLAPNGSLALLLARVLVRLGDAPLAERYLQHAEALGIASAVLAPLHAEVAFLQRRFDEVAPLLAEAREAARARPRLDAVVQFWTGPEPGA